MPENETISVNSYLLVHVALALPLMKTGYGKRTPKLWAKGGRDELAAVVTTTDPKKRVSVLRRQDTMLTVQFYFSMN